MEYPDKAFYQCKCFTHVLHVIRGIDVDYEKKEHYNVDIYLSMFHYGTENHKPTLKEKLRHCWKILKTGKNYEDNIILSLEDTKKLSKDLAELCDEAKIKEEVEKILNEKKEIKK